MENDKIHKKSSEQIRLENKPHSLEFVLNKNINEAKLQQILLKKKIMKYRAKLEKDINWEGAPIPYRYAQEHLDEFDKIMGIKDGKIN